MKEKGKVTKLINSFNFKHLENMNNGIFEVEMYKKKVLLDTPIQLGFLILQYAKLRMLEFYYDCLIKYLRPNSFELTEMDTDSMYMSLNRKNLDDCVRDEYKDKYFTELYDRCLDNVDAVWFPRCCCPKHIRLDRRFTGIMKLEFSGDKMISLCSKSYIIEDSNGRQKISCKGVSKKGLEEPMQQFRDTLFNVRTNTSTNMGFRMKNNSMFTYSQDKICFNYFYCKRKVMEDGISTTPLNICLSPYYYHHYF